jgi:hypothetical protein
MSCARGKAEPSDLTRLRLFADSGGFCQNPKCLRPLFIDAGGQKLHIGEMAHIFAATERGPRTMPTLSTEDRGAYENLILLCPSCHTIIDKAEDAYSDRMIQDWKEQHKARIAVAFGATFYPDRRTARQAIEPFLTENRAIFETYGPNQDYRVDPESDMALVWQRKVLSHILPNNHKLLAILDANRAHLTGAEREILERFRQHVDDLEHRHIAGRTASVGTTFPDGMGRLLEDV